MRAARCFIVGGLVPLACLAASGCGASGDAVVASVSGTPIHAQQLDHWTSVERAAGGGSSAKRRALDLLISWQWTRGEARTLGVSVSAAEARKQLGLSQVNKSSLISGFEWFSGEIALKPFLGNPKVSTPDQLRLVRMGMLAARVGAYHAAITATQVSRAEVVAYYERNRGLFRVGERRDIRAIMNLDPAKVLEARREMERHVPFHEIEERFNTSIEGGLRLGRARGTQQKRYEKDYFAAPLHHLIGPLHEILYYVFEVFSIKPGRQKSLAEVESAIRRHLAAHGPIGASVRAYEQRWRARTLCRAGLATDRCGGYRAKLG